MAIVNASTPFQNIAPERFETMFACPKAAGRGSEGLIDGVRFWLIAREGESLRFSGSDRLRFDRI